MNIQENTKGKIYTPYGSIDKVKDHWLKKDLNHLIDFCVRHSFVSLSVDEKMKLHSYNEGPAVVFEDGTKYWYKNGKLHREGGPAFEHPDGRKEWWLEGSCRIREFTNRFKEFLYREYRLNGKVHRDSGPAIEWHNGTKEWWINGVRHRKDGPTIEFANGSGIWYANGRITKVKGIQCK